MEAETKDSTDRFTNASLLNLLAGFFNNNWRNSNLTCMCKVTHCPGPRLLFEKVHFNRQNQIGRPAHAFTQRMDDLTGFPPFEWHLCVWLRQTPFTS